MDNKIKLLSEKQVREEIFHKSAVSFWQWRRSGKLDDLPTIILGSRRYYRPEDLAVFLDKRAKATK